MKADENLKAIIGNELRIVDYPKVTACYLW
jgi:hypothetical protein